MYSSNYFSGLLPERMEKWWIQSCLAQWPARVRCWRNGSYYFSCLTGPSLPLLHFSSLFFPPVKKHFARVQCLKGAVMLVSCFLASHENGPTYRIRQRNPGLLAPILCFQLSGDPSQWLAERRSQGAENSILSDSEKAFLKSPCWATPYSQFIFNSSFIPTHSFTFNSFPYLLLEKASSFFPVSLILEKTLWPGCPWGCHTVTMES